MAKRRNRLHYSTGDLFAFPIDVVGGYGVAMVGRITPLARKTGTDVVETYLFPFRWERVPTPEEVRDIKLEDFVGIYWMSDEEIRRKRYPIVGRIAGVDEQTAPCPALRHPMYWPDMSARRYFSRMPKRLDVVNRHIDRWYKIHGDPARYISKSEAKYLPCESGVCSPKYLEFVLSEIIQKKHPRIFSPGAKTIEIWRRIWDQLIAEGVVKVRKNKKPATAKSAG